MNDLSLKLQDPDNRPEYCRGKRIVVDEEGDMTKYIDIWRTAEGFYRSGGSGKMKILIENKDEGSARYYIMLIPPGESVPAFGYTNSLESQRIRHGISPFDITDKEIYFGCVYVYRGDELLKKYDSYAAFISHLFPRKEN